MKTMLIFADRQVFAENVYLTMLMNSWVSEKQTETEKTELGVYLSILSTLGKPN